jgi:hypothetical protein
MSEPAADCCDPAAPDRHAEGNGCSGVPCCRLKRPVPSSPALVDSPTTDLLFAANGALSVMPPTTVRHPVAEKIVPRSRAVPLFLLFAILLV